MSLEALPSGAMPLPWAQMVLPSQNYTAPAWTVLNGQAPLEGNIPSSQWAAANPSRLVCVMGGTYVIVGQALIQATTAAANRHVGLLKNGNGIGSCHMRDGTLNYLTLQASAITRLIPGDYIEVQVLCDVITGMTQPGVNGLLYWTMVGT
jgi:hypothetical protein